MKPQQETESTSDLAAALGERVRARVVDRLVSALRPGARVLELGCGAGVPTARQLAAAGCAVTGLDVSPVMVALARRNVPAATFLRRDLAGDLTDLGGFDAVVAFFTVLTLPRATIGAVLDGVHAALASGGVLALGATEPPAEVPGRGYSRTELVAALGAAGFRVLDSQTVGYQPAAGHGQAAQRRLFLLARRVGRPGDPPRLVGSPRLADRAVRTRATWPSPTVGPVRPSTPRRPGSRQRAR